MSGSTTQETWSSRMRLDLPRGWFAPEGQTPVLDGILAALGWSHEQACAWRLYVSEQDRLATVSDIFLDLYALDFLGTSLARNPSESNASFRTRIRAAILQPRATRAAITNALTVLTGTAPVLIEPFNPSDCGGYGTGALGYGAAGAYGSLRMPAQVLVTAYRPPLPLPAFSGLGGYGSPTSGYGVGAADYISVTSETGVTDADIYSAVHSVMAAGVVAWIELENIPPTDPGAMSVLDETFILDQSDLQ